MPFYPFKSCRGEIKFFSFILNWIKYLLTTLFIVFAIPQVIFTENGSIIICFYNASLL